MIKSMTGYGRAQGLSGGMNITAEIKSVNHRFFEFSARVSRVYGFLEEKLKSHLQSRIARGKVECFVMIETLETQDVAVEINHPLAAGYVQALRELCERYGLRDDLSVTSLARFPEVLSVRKLEADEENIWNAVLPVVEQALEAFLSMREQEGARLREDILQRAQEILKGVSFVEERSPLLAEEYHQRLRQRLEEVLKDTLVEEQRLVTEAAIFADKVAVAEETVRLRSHISQLQSFLESPEAVGRKLDFLVQELNREINTIGSKIQDVEISRRVVDMKSEVEKIREQIQNIE